MVAILFRLQCAWGISTYLYTGHGVNDAGKNITWPCMKSSIGSHDLSLTDAAHCEPYIHQW